MDYQVETIEKTILPVFIDPVTFCILSNNHEMKSMVNVETFMLTQLEHCMYYTKITYVTAAGCANQIFLSQTQSYCHVHCRTQPELSGLFLLVA